MLRLTATSFPTNSITNLYSLGGLKSKLNILSMHHVNVQYPCYHYIGSVSVSVSVSVSGCESVCMCTY